jgi:hypothetical protein
VTATYLGSLTIGGTMPGAAAVGVAGAAGINLVLPDLLAQIESLLSWTPTPISLTTQISTLEAMIAAIHAQITLNVPPPTILGQIVAINNLIASLQSTVASLEAQLAIIVSFQAALTAAGVHLVAYTGPVGSFGAEVQARLGSVPGLSPADASNAIAFLTTVPATWAALSTILKTEP